MITGHLRSEDKTLISHAYLSFSMDLLSSQHDLPSRSRVWMISLKAYGTLPPFKSAKYSADSIPTITACGVRTKERGEGGKRGDNSRAAPGQPGSTSFSLGQGMKGPGQKPWGPWSLLSAGPRVPMLLSPKPQARLLWFF